MSTITSSLDLESQVRQLREELERLKRGLATPFELTVAAERVYLGQPVAVTARVFSVSSGEPAPRVPVTFVATAGLLRVADAAVPSVSVTVSTGADGRARVTHVPLAARGLTDEEQQAVEGAVALLSPMAAGPADVIGAMESLAQAYRWDVAADLRAAVDRYADVQGLQADRLPPAELSVAWPTSEASVLAFVHHAHDEERSLPGVGVATTAAVSFRVVDWIPAFLTTIRSVLRGDSKLIDQLGRLVSDGNPDAAGIADGVFRRLDEYLSRAHGQIGKLIAADAGQGALATFVERQAVQLPADTRSELGDRLSGVRRASIGGGGTFVPTLAGTAAASAVIGDAGAKFDRVGQQKLLEYTTKLDGATVTRTGTFSDSIDRVSAERRRGYQTSITEVTDQSVRGHQATISAATSESLRGYQSSIKDTTAESLRGHKASLGEASDRALTDFREGATRESKLLIDQAQTRLTAEVDKGVDRLTTESGRLRTGLTQQVDQQLADFRRGIGDRLDKLERDSRELFTPAASQFSTLKADTDRNSRAINELSTTSARHDTEITKLDQKVERKAEADDVRLLRTETRASLDKKLDSTEFRTSSTDLNRRIGGLERGPR